MGIFNKQHKTIVTTSNSGREITIVNNGGWQAFMSGIGFALFIAIIFGYLPFRSGISELNFFFFIWFSLIGWFIFSIIRKAYWLAVGNEIITFNHNEISIVRNGYFLYKSQIYDLLKASKFRTHSPKKIYFDNDSDSQELIGSIAFDYGSKTITMGIAIEMMQAEAILAKLKSTGIIKDTLSQKIDIHQKLEHATINYTYAGLVEIITKGKSGIADKIIVGSFLLLFSFLEIFLILAVILGPHELGYKVSGPFQGRLIFFGMVLFVGIFCYIMYRSIWGWKKGSERILVGKQEITIYRSGFFRSSSNTYETTKTSKFRCEQPLETYRNSTYPSAWVGTIIFDYDGKQVRFGTGLEEAEGNHIIAVLQQKQLIK